MEEGGLTAREVVARAEGAGFELRATEDGAVMCRPPDVPEEIQRLIADKKVEVVSLLLDRQRHDASLGDRLEGLRRFAPGLFRTAATRDGREVLVWGVTPHGVIVSPAPGRPLLTLDPSELR